MKSVNFVKTPLLTISLLSTFLLIGCDQSPEAPKPETKKETAPTISVSEKKANFFSFLEPLIQQANAKVAKQRVQLLEMQSDLPDLSNNQKETLASFIKTYRVKDTLSLEEQVKQLSSKINTIPAALILAQAANESAWGTSRFAREGNNFFGQWCFSKGCGIVPNSRNAGAVHEVARFSSPLGSVEGYIRNLNSHPTYQLLRDLRQTALNDGKTASGETLAEGLLGYSERGEEYVKEIQQMIRYNKLSRFDNDTNTSTSDTDKG